MTNVTSLIWKKNISRNHELITTSKGVRYFIVVTGTEADYHYWEKRLNNTKPYLFREDNSTIITSVLEKAPKGNFLGTLNAWNYFRKKTAELDRIKKTEVILASMVIGKGIRLSPFTQVLNNCKSRMPTPAIVDQNLYLNVGELSNLYSNLLVEYLRKQNFHGLVVKWGDEIVIPGIDWNNQPEDFSDIDAVRFIWYTDPTPDLAREKEWMLVNNLDGLMVAQFARQEINNLLGRVNSVTRPNQRLGVNLGSLAISYDFLDLALKFFSDDLNDPLKMIDWDPYVWVAITCNSIEEWNAEIDRESQNGGSGLAKLQEKYPDFFNKIQKIKKIIETKKGSSFKIKVIDYGEVFWTDFGQHLALRKTLSAILSRTELGLVTRELFSLPLIQDENGNIIINSEVPTTNHIQNSIIINSIISSKDSLIQNGIVIGSKHDLLFMPQGGISLFSLIRYAYFYGPNAICFYSISSEIQLQQGGRHSTLVTPNKNYQLFANEQIYDLKGDNFTNPVQENPISFEEASKLISTFNQDEIDDARMRAERQIFDSMNWV